MNLPAGSITLYEYPFLNVNTFGKEQSGVWGNYTGDNSGLPGSDPILWDGGFQGVIGYAIHMAGQLRAANGGYGSIVYMADHVEPGGGLGGGLGGGGGRAEVGEAGEPGGQRRRQGDIEAGEHFADDGDEFGQAEPGAGRDVVDALGGIGGVQRGEPDLAAGPLENERTRLALDPVVVAVVSRAAAHGKIPEWEQVLCSGAVCMNLLVAAQAMGFAASWLTQWYSYDRRVVGRFGVGEGENVAGFVHIGHASGRPEDRIRPVLSDIVTRFQG